MKSSVVKPDERRVVVELEGSSGLPLWVELPGKDPSCVYPFGEALAAAKAKLGKTVAFTPWKPTCTTLEIAGLYPDYTLLAHAQRPMVVEELEIGAASAHFQNSGLLLYLWTFVAGHGVLELFAIWCAGAAGFMLGLAVLRPGPYTRRDALVLNARIAMRLVGAAIVLLLVAGAIEGFLSTSDAPARVKVAVSVASALLLVAYLANGARHRDAAALAPPP